MKFWYQCRFANGNRAFNGDVNFAQHFQNIASRLLKIRQIYTNARIQKLSV